jgi:uncharacterized protein
MKKNIKFINRFFSIIFIVMLLVVQTISAQAADINLKPTSLKYVNDYNGVIDRDSENFMVSLGSEVESKTGAQMTTVVIKSLQGADITAYANQLFRQWGIGQKGKDNGLLILVSIDDKKWKVEVGRGLEGSITDIYSARVMDASAPLFKEQKYGQGLVKAFSAFATNIAKENNVTLDNNTPQPQVSKNVSINPIYIYIILALILMDLLFNKARVSRIILYTIFWSSFFGGGRNNGGGNSGGFGGGGSAGSGGGFGGGTSGGGGSSGGW